MRQKRYQIAEACVSCSSWHIAPIVVLIVGLYLWPFGLEQRQYLENGAAVQSDVGGIKFEKPGFVVDEGAAEPITKALMQSNEITVAVSLESASLSQSGPARIISLSWSPWKRNFTLAQERDAMVFRLRTPVTGENGTNPAATAAFAFNPGERQVLVATYQDGHFRLYVDGDLATKLDIKPGGFGNWSASYPLVLGNEATGDRPWLGTLFDVAIYDRAMESEEIPTLSREILARPDLGLIYHLSERCPSANVKRTAGATVAGTCTSPDRFPKFRRWTVLDVGTIRQREDYLFNFLIWFPVGAVAFGRSRNRRAQNVGIGFGLLATATALELAQAPVLARTSSLHDVVAAMLGATAGAAVARILKRRVVGRH